VDLSEIGTLFREARRRSRRTQGELAQALRMSRATLSALECGRCDEIGVRKLTALLESVGLDLSVGPRKTRPTLDDLRAERRGEKGRG
jgi:transcriptional regulator with XRE-family HTH domain